MKKRRHAGEIVSTQYPRIISQAPKPISTVSGNGPSIYSKPSVNSTPETDSNQAKTERGNFFHKEGDAWNVSFDGKTVPNIKHSKGMDYIKYLLENPYRHTQASAFIKTPPTPEEANQLRKMNEDQLEELRLTKAVSLRQGNKEKKSKEVVERDLKTKGEFRKKISELTETINDPGSLQEEVSKAQVQKKLYLEELKAFRDRSTDRQRTAVSNAIGRAITHITKHHPSLADHLRNHIHLGNECIYSPHDNPDWNK